MSKTVFILGAGASKESEIKIGTAIFFVLVYAKT